MGRYRTLSVLVVCVVVATSVVFLAGPVFGGSDTHPADEDGPQAEAGLDQTVRQGVEVTLDAGGSVAPDGEIVSYNWTIRRPDNTTAVPDCPTCRTTQFRPSEPGTYVATVEVTDDSNRTATDRMYVTVEAHEPPNPEILGPNRLASNETATLELRATGGDEPLHSVAWYRDDDLKHGKLVDESRYKENVTISFPDPGSTTVELLAADEVGHTQTAVHNLTVTPAPPYFAVEITDTEEVSDKLLVDIEVSNTGGLNGTQEVRLCRRECAPGRVIESLGNVSLQPRENTTLTATWPNWGTESGEVIVAAESADDRDTVRKILAEPSHISIEGVPEEMEDGSETNVTTVLHYEGGITEDVTADASYSVSQTEPHSYVTIPEQDQYNPLAVRAVATEDEPDSNGDGIIQAEYAELTDQARTTVIPECEINPDSPGCSGDWEYEGDGRGEWLWRLQGVQNLPNEIDVSETITPGSYIFYQGEEQYVRMDILIFDYVNIDGRSGLEADPNADYTERAEEKDTFRRVRSPEMDEALWAWEPNSRFDQPYRADQYYAGDWKTEWDRWSSMTGAEGSAFVVMDQGVIDMIDPRQEGAVDICLELRPRVFEPRNDYGRYSCQSMEIVDEDDDSGGKPGS